MSYVTALKAKGEQAGIYVTTPGITNGLSGCGGRCSACRSGFPCPGGVADFYDASGVVAVAPSRRVPSIMARPTYAPGGSDLGVPLAAGATWFGFGPGKKFQQPPPQKGLSGLLDGVFSKLGLLDVVAQEYPGMTMADAYKALKADVDLAKRKLPGLRSATARSILARQISSISSTVDSLGGAFSKPDSQIGKREKDAMVEAILDNRAYTKAWRDAKKQFGYADPDTGATEGLVAQAAPSLPAVTPAAAAPAETPWGWIIGGAAAALAVGVLAGSTRRRSA